MCKTVPSKDVEQEKVEVPKALGDQKGNCKWTVPSKDREQENVEKWGRLQGTGNSMLVSKEVIGMIKVKV